MSLSVSTSMIPDIRKRCSIGDIDGHGMDIVKHVPTRAKNIDEIIESARSNHNELLLKIGLRMNQNLICGSNSRCVAMLVAFKSIINSLSDQDTDYFIKSLNASLESAISFLNLCRPLSVSMTNTHRQLKFEISKIQQQISTSQSQHKETSTDVSQIKEQLTTFIDQFIIDEIWSAQRGICENAAPKINQNDFVLVYGCSSIAQHVLLHATQVQKRQAHVIVVDCQPNFYGRRMLEFLTKHSIPCTYTLINSLSYVMRRANKVLLGAHSILANGYAMAQIGTSQIALMARAHNVPVLVCCETYKFSDRVYVDSFVCNEVDKSIQQSDSMKQQHTSQCTVNLHYDVTPPEFVSMLITEKNTIPAISVPAILRFRLMKNLHEA